MLITFAAIRLKLHQQPKAYMHCAHITNTLELFYGYLESQLKEVTLTPHNGCDLDINAIQSVEVSTALVAHTVPGSKLNAFGD